MNIISIKPVSSGSVSDRLRRANLVILKMVKAFLRISFCIVGLVGFGIILGEVLKKWQAAGPDFNIGWVVVPILVLFFCREITRSDYIREKQVISPQNLQTLTTVLNLVFILLSILVCLGIPYLWFGTIEELGKRGGG